MPTSRGKRVFLSYHGVDGPASDAITYALREAGLKVFRDRDSLVPGQFWPERLEQALIETDGVVVCLGPNGLGSWQKREIALALERQTGDFSFPVIPVLLPGTDDPPLSFLRFGTWVDLRQGIDDPKALRTLVRAVRGEPPLAEDASPDPRSAVCPYRGLEAFREEDAPFFFGREDLVQRLAAKVRRAPMTALLGPSGSGKSSLVQAGLLPVVHADLGATWHMVSLRPGNDPLVALAAAFDPPPANAGLTEQLAYLNDAAARLRRGKVRLRQLAESVLASLPHAGRLLVVVDQWEELYTQASRSEGEADDGARFVTLIFEAAGAERFHSLLVLRTDFYEEASRHPGMPQFLAEHQVPVEGILREGLERAITGPAAAVGLHLEDGLLERILDDVGDEPGNLPLLEHALYELWRRRQGVLLTFDAYRAIGGVRGAIAERARQAYDSLRPAEQAAARRLLVSLVTPGEGGRDTRGRILLPEEAQEREVVRRFAGTKNRLLVTGRDPVGRAIVEISHEALIRSWDKLRNWVGETRELLQIRQRIRSDMAHWESNARSPSLLLPRGRRLEEARSLLSHGQQVVIDDLRPYIRPSLRRDAVRRWTGYAVAGFFVILASVAAIYFYQLQLRAEAELRRAVETDGRRIAQVARRYLESGQPHRAIMVAREAFGPLKEGLPLAERPYIWQAADVLHRALAARPILRKVFRGHTRVVNMAAFSPDGKHIASAGVDGRVFILDVRTLAVEHLIIPNPETFNDNVFGHDDSVDWVAFSPDGERLATANEDGSVRIFSIRDGKQVLRFQAYPGMVGSVSFTPDGSSLLTTPGPALGGPQVFQARLWNAADGTLVRSIIKKSDCCIGQGVVGPDGARAAIVESNAVSVWGLGTGEKLLHLGGAELSQSLAFSPDGERLATGDGDHLVRIWDSRRGVELLTLRGHEQLVGSVAFSSDGRYLVTTDAGPAAEALIWDAKSGQRIASLLGHEVGLASGIRSATFSPDGRFIVTTAKDNTVRLWEFAHPDPARLLRDEGNPNRFTFSPDGSLIAASGEEAALVWRVAQDKAMRLGDPPEAAVVFSPDSSRLLVPGRREAFLYDMKTGERLRSFSPAFALGDLQTRPQFSPDGSKIASFSEAFKNRNLWNIIRIWDAENGKELAVISPTEDLGQLAFVGKGDRLMTTGGSFIRFWDVRNRASPVEIRVREGDSGGVDAAASPDGTLVAAGDAWIRAAVWDTRTGNLVTELKDARDKTVVQRFTPDGRYVVTTDDVGTIGFWDPRSGHLVRTIHGPEAGITSFDIPASGRRLLVGGKDQTLRAWDVETGSLLFFADLVPYRTENFHMPKETWRISAVLNPAGNQILAHIIPFNEPGLVFDLPHKNFADLIEAAYAAVPYRFTADERAELELDLFGRPDPRTAELEELTVKVPY